MKSHIQAGFQPTGTVVLAPAGELAAAEAALAAGAGLIDLWEAAPDTVVAFRDRHPEAPVCAAADWAAVVRDPALAQRTGALLVCDGPAGAARAQAAGLPRERLLVEVPPALATGLLAGGWRVIVHADGPPGPPGPVVTGAGPGGAESRGAGEAGPPDDRTSGGGTPDGGTPSGSAPAGGAPDKRATDHGATDHGAAGHRGTAVAGVAATAALAAWLGATAVRTAQVTAARRAIDMTASIRGIRPLPGGYGRT